MRTTWSGAGRPQRVVVVAAIALVVVIPACSAASSTTGGGPGSTPTWTVAVPEVKPHTLDESQKIIHSDPKSGPSSLEAAKTSAAVFAVGDDKLNASDPAWTALVADVCGPNGLLGEALGAGWNVTVTGYVDSSGPMGPGTLNERLQDGRAAAAAKELGTACKIPDGRVVTARGGVAGDGAEARKVVVTYTRTPGGAG